MLALTLDYAISNFHICLRHFLSFKFGVESKVASLIMFRFRSLLIENAM